MNLFKLLGLISTVALLLPLVTLLVTKLSVHKSFPFLFVYYLVIFSFNLLLLGYIPVSTDVRRYHAIANNFLDAPLMLGFILYFARTPIMRLALKYTVIAVIAFEVVVLFVKGFTRESSIIVSGPGMMIVCIYAALFFIHQAKITVVYHKAAGKALIIASVLFAYIGFIYVYAVFYFMNIRYQRDAHLVFFLITIFSSISIAVGMVIERKRVRAVSELLTTREELKQLYAGQQKQNGSPLDAIVFGYDKKQWN